MRSLCLLLLACLALAAKGELVIESADIKVRSPASQPASRPWDDALVMYGVQIDGSSFTISTRTALKFRNDGSAAAKAVTLCETEEWFAKRALLEVGVCRLAPRAAQPQPRPPPSGAQHPHWRRWWPRRRPLPAAQ